MEARIAAREEAERPQKEVAARRKVARAVVNLIFSFPEADRRPVAVMAIKAFRPDIAHKFGLR